jgi:CMP-N-acetylneuraminic acid synthetase
LKAVILARGGSKGVPGKNIRKLNGIPLLAYPIMSAHRTKGITGVFVSTDDEEIKNVALGFDAQVIDRPSEFAQDNSLDIDAMRHVVNYLDDYDDMVHLRATTPMIKSDILDDAINYFLQNTDCTSLRSAHEAPETAYKSFKQNDIYWSGLFDNEFDDDYYNLPRQLLPKTYNPNGYIDIIRPKHFYLRNNLHGDKMLAYITPFAHDVDTLDDFKILEAIYD